MIMSWKLQYLYYYELIKKWWDGIKYDVPNDILAPILASNLNAECPSALQTIALISLPILSDTSSGKKSGYLHQWDGRWFSLHIKKVPRGCFIFTVSDFVIPQMFARFLKD